MIENAKQNAQLALFQEYNAEPAAAGIHALLKLVEFVGDVIAGIGRGVAVARTLQALNTLDDRQLADIGVSRVEIPAYAVAVVDGTVEQLRAAKAEGQVQAEVADETPELPLAA